VESKIVKLVKMPNRYKTVFLAQVSEYGILVSFTCVGFSKTEVQLEWLELVAVEADSNFSTSDSRNLNATFRWFEQKTFFAISPKLRHEQGSFCFFVIFDYKFIVF
jgi:hypothetical protein